MTREHDYISSGMELIQANRNRFDSVHHQFILGCLSSIKGIYIFGPPESILLVIKNNKKNMVGIRI